MKRTKARFLSALLAVCMVLSMLPAGIIAAEETTLPAAIEAVKTTAKATVWPEGEAQPGDITAVIPNVVFPDLYSPDYLNVHLEVRGLTPNTGWRISFAGDDGYYNLSSDENGVGAVSYFIGKAPAAGAPVTLTAEVFQRGSWDDTLDDYTRPYAYAPFTLTTLVANQADYPLSQEQLDGMSAPLSTGTVDAADVECYLPYDLELGQWLQDHRASWTMKLVKDGICYAAPYGSNFPRCSDSSIPDPRFDALFESDRYMGQHQASVWRVGGYLALARPLVPGSYDAVLYDADGSVLYTVKDAVTAVDAPVVTRLNRYGNYFYSEVGGSTAYAQMDLIGGDPADYVLKLYDETGSLLGTSGQRRTVRAGLGETTTVYAIELTDGAVLDKYRQYTIRAERTDGAPCIGESTCSLHVDSNNYQVLEAFLASHYYLNAMLRIANGAGATLRFELGHWGEVLSTLTATGDENGVFDLEFTDEAGQPLPMEPWTDYDISVYSRDEGGEWWHQDNVYLYNEGVAPFEPEPALESRQQLEVEFDHAWFDLENDAFTASLRVSPDSSLTDPDAFSAILTGVGGTEYGPIALSGSTRDYSSSRQFSLTADLPESIPHGHYFAALLYHGELLVNENGENIFYEGDTTPWSTLHTDFVSMNRSSTDWLGLDFMTGVNVTNSQYASAPEVRFYPAGIPSMEPAASIRFDGARLVFNETNMADLATGQRYHLEFADNGKTVNAYTDDLVYAADPITINALWEQYYLHGTYPTRNVLVDELMENGSIEILSPFGAEADAIPTYSEVYARIIPDEGYEYVPGSLRVNGKPILGRGFLVTEDCVVTARFRVPAVPTYFITPNTSWVTNGWLQADRTEAQAGETVLVTAFPDEGYTLSEAPWYLLEGDATEEPHYLTPISNSDGGYTFVMPEGNVELFARFTALPRHYFRVRLSDEELSRFEHLSYRIDWTRTDDLTQIPMGKQVTLHFTAIPGWGIDAIYAEGHSTSTRYNFYRYGTDGDGHTVWALDGMPDENADLYITFRELSSFAISVDTAVMNGALSVDRTQAYPGQRISGTWQANSGYALDWIYYVDEKGVTCSLPWREDGTFSFEMPEHAVVISATFRELPAESLGGTVTSAEELQTALGGTAVASRYEELVKLERDVVLLSPISVTSGAMILDLNGYTVSAGFAPEEESALFAVSGTADFTITDSSSDRTGVVSACSDDTEEDAAGLHAVWVTGGAFRLQGAHMCSAWAEYTTQHQTHATLCITGGTVVLGEYTDPDLDDRTTITTCGAADAVCITGGSLEVLGGNYNSDANWADGPEDPNGSTTPGGSEEEKTEEEKAEEEAAGKNSSISTYGGAEDDYVPEGLAYARSGDVIRVSGSGSVTIRGGQFHSHVAGHALLVEKTTGTVLLDGGYYGSEYGDATVKITDADSHVTISGARIYCASRSIRVPETKAIADYLAEGVSAWANFDYTPYELTEADLQKDNFDRDLAIAVPVTVSVRIHGGKAEWTLPYGDAIPGSELVLRVTPAFGYRVNEAWYTENDETIYFSPDSRNEFRFWLQESTTALDIHVQVDALERWDGLFSQKALSLQSENWNINSNYSISSYGNPYAYAVLTDISGKTILMEQETRPSSGHLNLTNPGNLPAGTYRLYVSFYNDWGVEQPGWDYIELTNALPYYAWAQGQLAANSTELTAQLQLETVPITAIPEGLTLQLWNHDYNTVVAESSDFSIAWNGAEATATGKEDDATGSTLVFRFTLKQGMLNSWCSYTLIPKAPGVSFLRDVESFINVTDSPYIYHESFDPATLTWTGTCGNIADGSYTTTYSSEATGWMETAGPNVTVASGVATMVFTEAPFDLEAGGSVWYNLTIPDWGVTGFDVRYWPETGGKAMWSQVYIENGAWVNYYTYSGDMFDYILLPEEENGSYLPFTMEVSAPNLKGMSGSWRVCSQNNGSVIAEGTAEDLSSFTATLTDFNTYWPYRLELYAGGDTMNGTAGSTPFILSFESVLGADPMTRAAVRDGKLTLYPQGFSASELASLHLGVRKGSSTTDVPFTVNADGTLTLDMSQIPVGSWTIVATYQPGKDKDEFPVPYTTNGWTIRIRPDTAESIRVKAPTVTEQDGVYSFPVEYIGGTPDGSVTMTVFRRSGDTMTPEAVYDIGSGAYTVSSKALDLSGSFVVAFSLADGTLLGVHAVDLGEADALTVTFVDWNGTVLDTQTVLHGKDAAAPAVKPVREGWVFTGWNVSLRGIVKDTVATAVYVPASLTVQFYGADGIDDSLTQQVAYGSAASMPETKPEREGYWFVGWGKTPNATKEWFFDKALFSNTIFYAIWEKAAGELFIDEASSGDLSLHGYDASKGTWQLNCYNPDVFSGLLAVYENGIRQTVEFDRISWLFHVPNMGTDVTVSLIRLPDPIPFTLTVNAPANMYYDVRLNRTGNSDAAGHYLSGTGTGAYELQMVPGSYTLDLTAYQEAGDSRQYAFIEVSETSASASVTVTPLVQASGTIIGVSGKKTVLEFWGERWYSAYADENGNFWLPAMPAGDYTVYCYDGGRYVALTNHQVTLSADSATVSLSVLPSANVLATVFTSETRPAHQVSVILEKQDGSSWSWVDAITCSGEGGSVALFENAVTEPGTYRVRMDYMTNRYGIGLGYVCEPFVFTVEDELKANYTTELVYFYPQTDSHSALSGEGNAVTLDRTSALPGEFVNLTVRYRNNGSSTLQNVAFLPQLPEGITLHGDEMNTTVDAIVPGESGSVTVTLKVSAEGEAFRKIPVLVSLNGSAEAPHFGDGLLSVSALTLTGPTVVALHREFTLTGEATPGSKITITDLATGTLLGSTEAVGRYYSVTVYGTEARDGRLQLVAQCSGQTSEVLTIPVSEGDTPPAVRNVTLGGDGLNWNSKLNSFTAWQYVDLDLRGVPTELKVLFNNDELTDYGRILTVKFHFCGSTYTAEKDSEGQWTAWLTDWGGAGLKTVTAEVFTADGLTHMLTAAYVNLLIDPSGTVTDETGAPLEGVTVTCLQLVDGVWTIWNAEAYGQMNPVVTGADGKYSFMVPEGTYRIMASREGFEDYDSLEDQRFSQDGGSTVIIPPPRTDVDFVMVARSLQVYPTVSTGGSAIADTAVAGVGQTVTVKLTPNEGYRATGASVITAGGKAIDVQFSENSATFLMPADSVTVSGVFAFETEPSVAVEIENGTAVVTTENIHTDAILYVALYTAEGRFLSASLRSVEASFTVSMGEAGMIRVFLLDGENTLRPLSQAAWDRN